MFLDQGQSWRQGSRPQPVDQAQDLSEQRSWYDGFLLARPQRPAESKRGDEGNPGDEIPLLPPELADALVQFLLNRWSPPRLMARPS